VWRVLDALDEELLTDLRLAHAQARDGCGRSAPRSAGTCPSRRRAGRAGRVWWSTWTRCWWTAIRRRSWRRRPSRAGSVHPLLAWRNKTHEALAGRLRPGNAGANTAAYHIWVLYDALAQIPDEHRHGVPLLLRADGAGATREFLTHIRSLREQGIQAEFSVGFAITEQVRNAIGRLPASVGAVAIEESCHPARALRELLHCPSM
jgi:hypothetical protein